MIEADTPKDDINLYPQAATLIPGQRDTLSEGGTTAVSPFTFALIHGAWHTSGSWRPLQDRLESLGHETIAPDLPAGDTTATFDTDADLVSELIKDTKNIFILGHSRGGEMIPRVLSRISLDGVAGAAFLNSGGPHAYRLDNPERKGPESPIDRYNPEYLIGIQEHSDGTTSYNQTFAREIFYNDVEDHEVALAAVNMLRLQRKPTHDDSPLPPMPEGIPIYYILSNEDKVLNVPRARRLARQWLGVNPIEIPGGHTPQLSRPELLATKLVELAIASSVQRTIQL